MQMGRAGRRAQQRWRGGEECAAPKGAEQGGGRTRCGEDGQQQWANFKFIGSNCTFHPRKLWKLPCALRSRQAAAVLVPWARPAAA